MFLKCTLQRMVNGVKYRNYATENRLPLEDVLIKVIKTTGPLSVASFMRTCLTHSKHGYYSKGKDPFGPSGDFVTSPEISQMFGELIGIWLVSQWRAQQRPEYTLIELGPGRGTLLDDALRTLQALPDFAHSLRSIHLIESSSILRELQARKLLQPGSFCFGDDKLWRGIAKIGCPVTWHEDLKTLDQSPFPFVIAHEFFDALPIHKFERTSEGWTELLVDIHPNTSPIPPKSVFQLVRTNKPTALGETIANTSPRYHSLPIGSRFEFSPDALDITRDLSKRIKHGGAVLIADYGPEQTIPVDTLRGIQQHKITSPFEAPGATDLSADIDFQGIKEVALNEKCQVYGPVEQGIWLQRLGINERTQQLMARQNTQKGRHRIEISRKRLIENSHGSMGKAYKFMSILPNGGPTPVGFGGEVLE